MKQNKTLRVLIVEDSEDDTTLLLRELRRGGFVPEYTRVEDAGAMRAALREAPWDIILCDHVLPRLDSFMALGVAREERSDIPFIVVSGVVGEDVAVEVPAIIGKTGARAIPQAKPEPAIRGLMQAVKAYESLTVDAAVRGDRELAFQAMLANPLMPGATESRVLLDELLEINKPYLQGTFF